MSEDLNIHEDYEEIYSHNDIKKSIEKENKQEKEELAPYEYPYVKKSIRDKIKKPKQNNKNINPPQHYWKIAKDYIIKLDKKLQKENKFYVDKDFALKCIKFTSLLKHTAGKLENKNFQFSEWQIKAIVNIFGQKYVSGEYKGLRRYQRALFHMPKKNGKTETGAIFHLIMFFLDGSLSKEQYCIASDKEQALILHEAIETMIYSNDYNLKSEIAKATIQPPRITKYDSSGIYKQTITSLAKPLGDEKDGKKVTFFTSDEGHAQSSKNLYQLIKNGMALVEEPLEINLSTSGYNMQGYYYTDIYQYACKVRDGVIKDERFYYEIFELEEKDYLDEEGNEKLDFWKDRKLWAKVNPNLGISPTFSFMEGLVSEAENSQESLIAFKTKHLNLWLDKPDVWVDHRIWTKNQNQIDVEKLKGKVCYGGLDLATRWDLASLVLVFPDDSQGFRRYDILCRFWIPKDNMLKRVQKDKVPYFDFIKDGLIEATPGDSIDYDYIEKQIKQDCEDFDVKMIAYDRFNSTRIVQVINEAECTEMIPYNQTTVWFNAPVNELELLAHQGKLNHANNKVLNWHCSNIVTIKDSNGNVKFDKNKSIEKIDGMVSLAMAMGVCLKDVQEEEKVNVYEKRGMLIL